MHTLFGTKTALTPFCELALRIREDIFGAVQPLEQHVVIPAHASVDTRWAGRPAIFVIEEGCLHVSTSGGGILVYEEGDIVGANSSALYPLSVETPGFAAVVSVYSSEAVRTEAARSSDGLALWNEFLAASSTLFLTLLGERLQTQCEPTPRVRLYRSGETIVKQGAEGNTVLTMVEGDARVEVDGVTVGEVHKDEIFGAIAAITRSHRGASVVANSNCLVMELEADQFQAMLQTHPLLIERLIRDMARTINSLNREVIEQSHASLL